MRWYREYLYRRIFPISHLQYLDESGDGEVTWMIRIHALVTEQKNRRRRERAEAKARARGGRL